MTASELRQINAAIVTVFCVVCIVQSVSAVDLKFLVMLDAPDLPAVRTAADDIIIKSQVSAAGTVANVSLEYQVVSDTGSLQDLVANICSKLPIAGIVYLSSVPHARCLAASLARHLDVAFIAGAAPASETTATCGPDPLTVQYSLRPFIQSVGPFAAKLNLTGVPAAAVLYDGTWDPAALLPTQELPGPAYLFRLPSNATQLPRFLDNVRNRTMATLFVLATEVGAAQLVLTAAKQVKLTTRFFTWFYLNSGLVGLKSQQLVYQVSFLPSGSVAMANATGRTGSDSAVAFAAHVDTLTLLMSGVNSMMSAAAPWVKASFMSPVGNCSAADISARNFSVTEVFADSVKALSNVSLLIGKKLAAFSGALLRPHVTLNLQTCLSGHCQSTGWGFNSQDGGAVVQLPAGVNASLVLQKPRLFLKVLALPEPPFVFYNSDNGTYSGYSIAVLEEIAKRLDFDYNISQPVDSAYGVAHANGTWTGMIGSLMTLDADIAVGPISVTSERQRVVDFSIPYYDYAGLQIFMRRINGGRDTSMFFFVTVFDGYVWLCLGATLVVTGFLVTLFDKLSPYSFQNRTQDELPEGEPEGKMFSFKESMWFVLGAVTQAGESFDPRATSTRFLVAGFWIFSCIIMALYTANLAAFLTVSKLSASISSVRELASQTTIKYSVQRDTIGFSFFQQMRDIESKFYDVWRDLSVQTEFSSTSAGGSLYTVWEYPIEEQYTDMFRRMSSWGFFNSTDEAIAMVRSGDWAMFLDTPLIKYYMGKDCDLTSTGQVLSSRPYGIALQKNSPLTSLLNLAILGMQNDRTIESYKVYWWEREKVQCPADQPATGVQLKTLSGVFVFLGGGVVAGLIVLVVELVVAKVWGTERFKPDSMIVNHLAPRPASFRRSVRSETFNHHDGEPAVGPHENGNGGSAPAAGSKSPKLPDRLTVDIAGGVVAQPRAAGQSSFSNNNGLDASHMNGAFSLSEMAHRQDQAAGGMMAAPGEGPARLL